MYGTFCFYDREPRTEAFDEWQVTLVELMAEWVSAQLERQVVEETEPVDLAVVAPEAWSTVATAEGTLEASEAPSIRVDRSRLVQLLENLFRNAVEHGGDDVSVTVGPIDDPGRAGFYVADDGPGIPEADREAVFDHGYTNRDGETGFGLSIVREIATAHGWTVSAASGAGGARFEFVDVRPA